MDRLRTLGWRRALVGVVMVVLCLAALRDFSRLGVAAPWHTMYDFPDFYCGGVALDGHASPYRYEPLHSCELRANVAGAFRSAFFEKSPTAAIPAPLPPYDFLPYMALARAPISVAVVIGFWAILGAVVLSVVGLWLLRIPMIVSAAALSLCGAFIELNTGQFVPFGLVLLVFCGVALHRGNAKAAGLLAALTLTEPLIGLPVCAAVFLFVPKSRATLIASACGLAVVAVALVGWRELYVYATEVLPAQAASEVHFPYQYSLTYLLAAAHLPTQAARLLGMTSYFAMLIVGLKVATTLNRRLERPELLAFFPALCALIGGGYVHAEELCFAIPAVLVLAYANQGMRRTIFALSICVLAVPWLLVWGEKQLFLPSIFVCAAIVLALQCNARVAISGLAVIAALIYAFEIRPPALPAPVVPAHGYSSGQIVQQEWSAYADSRSTTDLRWLAIKVPTWIALLGVVLLASMAPARDEGINRGTDL